MTETKINVLLSIGILMLFGVYQSNAQYVVDVMRMTSFGEEELVHKCAATGGNFGKDVTDFIISDENLGCAVSLEPADACGPVRIAHNHTRTCRNLFAFVSRSDHEHPCNFSHQAFMVQNSSYPFRLVIFYNYPGQDPISMEGRELRDKINLPVLMISHTCKDDIARRFSDTAGFRLRVRIDPGYYELFRYLIPFLVVIVFCFALFMITLCVRGCVERRKLNKRRLSKRNLKKIPVKKYRSGDDPDTCAICLEVFIPGEKLRHLPCKHVFHCKCIDVWLTQTRKVCPLCKRKIGSDSDSECSDHLFPEDTRGGFAEGEDYQGVEEFAAVPTGQSLDMWSSREALVDQDIALMRPTRSTISGFMRNAMRRMRHPSAQPSDNGVGLENNAYLVRQQATDNAHLLENEASNPTSGPSTSSDLPSTSITDETITTTTTVTADPAVPTTCESSSTFPTC